MAENTVRETHRWLDANYVEDWIKTDRTRDTERLPRLRMMAGFIPFDKDDPIRILDVGAGYGLVTDIVLNEFPRSTVVYQDSSEPMLCQARWRLRQYGERVIFCQSDLMDPRWVESLPGPFDAVISAIAIHNLRHPERIRQVYAEIFTVVKPGGCFLNSEIVGPGGEITGSFYRRPRLLEMQTRLKETGVEKSLEELEEEQRRAGRQGNPRSPSLESYLHWLRQAGFDEVDCFSKELGQAIFGGYRSNGR